MPRPAPTPERVEMVLRDLAPRMEFPAAPDIRAAVVSQLESTPQDEIVHLRPPHRGLRPIYAVAALVVALGLFFSFSSGARRAVAEWLGVAGVQIEIDNESTPTAPASSELGLGEPVSLAEAASAAPFDLKLPAVGPFADPDTVLVDRSAGGVRVTFVYEPGGGIPPSEVTGTGAILSQFDAEVMAGSIKKVSSDGSVRLAEINGMPAYFISGAPHLVGYSDAEGNLVPDTSRLAGNVLLWELGDITFRLESELTFEQALRVARSIR